MSRVGNSPIAIPEGVNVDIKPNELVVSGKLGSLSQAYDCLLYTSPSPRDPT